MIELDGSNFIKKSKLCCSDGKKKYSVLPTVLFYTSKYFRKKYEDSYLPSVINLETSYQQDVLSSLLKFLHEDQVSIKKSDFGKFVQIALDLEIDSMYTLLIDICKREKFTDLQEKIESEILRKEKEKETSSKKTKGETIDMETDLDITEAEKEKLLDTDECIDFLSELFNSNKSRFFYLLTQVEYQSLLTEDLKRLYEDTNVAFLNEIITFKSLADDEIEKCSKLEEKNSELIEETEKLKDKIEDLKKRGSGGGSSSTAAAEEVEKLKNEVEELNEKLEKLQNEKDDLEEKLKNEAKRSGSGSSVSAAPGEVEKLKKKLEKLQNEKEDLEEKLKENEDNFSSVLSQMDEKDNEIDTLKAIISESDVTELKNEIKILNTKCKKYENELSVLKEKKISSAYSTTTPLSYGYSERPTSYVREPEKKMPKAPPNFSDLLTNLVQRNKFADFKEFIESQDIPPNFVDKDGKTLLHVAAINDRREFIKYLIQLDDIDVNIKDKYGKTPLHYAIENRRDESAKILVACEKVALDILTTDAQQTILHTAAAKNFDTFIKFLSIYLKEHPSRNPSRDVNINMKDKNGKTAIHIAAQKGMDDALKALIQFNPTFDINLQDSDGRTALHWAASTGRGNTVKFLLEIESINVNIKDINGRTPAFLASENKRTEILKQIIACPTFDPNLTDKDGNALIISCAQKGNIEIAKCLLECPGVNFDIRDNFGRTPLHITAENGKTEFLQWLIETGKVDLRAKNSLGRTAYDIACITRSPSRDILERYR